MKFNPRDIFNRNSRDNKKFDRSNTPLYKAVREGNVTKVKRLLEHGVDPNICDGHHMTVLHLAAYWGETEIVKLLIKHHADVNIDNGGKGWTPLHSAAISGGLKNREEIISLLVKAGADAEKQDICGFTPKDYMMLWESDAAAAERIKMQMAALAGPRAPGAPSTPKKPPRPHTPKH